MFDKLEDLVKRLDEVMQELSEPDVFKKEITLNAKIVEIGLQ